MRLRAPLPDDAPAVHALLVTRDLADLGTPDWTIEDVRDEWKATDLDLACDARVVADERGRIAAYAIVRRPGAFAVVAPDREGEGIGARLLEWVEAREREQGRPLHRQWVNGGNERARQLLAAAGYDHVRSYFQMSRALDQVGDCGDAGDPPDGVAFRTPEVARDAAAVHAVDTASFAGAPDYEAGTLEAFIEEHLHAHDFDPELSAVAERDREIVGFALVRRRSSEKGFVDVLGVHPAHQRRGIGASLLRRVFARAAGAGLREVELGVASDNERGLRLYERLGMISRLRGHVFERPLN